ncbi:TetR/AcrR family transcriptional regulator [Thiomicrorhabdus cannonii]|uniref:TetR/AcrR family transcriptional regulator n=1 Tax=Thiomicrorhabdus cannonii TaxID=2748011 RepID=UPI0015B8F89E|nr:TetR/AcrR family transcriptional regulator [Thiomicrorhabdus cannonii]
MPPTASSPVLLTKRGLARQQKLLEVAERAFLQNGYAATSVNEIVRQAGGSLGTLYRQFGNKLGLFEAVFKKKSQEIFAPFDDDALWSDDMAKSLYTFGHTLQHIALSADGVAIYRLVVSENNLDQGEIQKIFYRHGPQTAIRVLARYLEKQMKAQRIELLNAELAAQQFLEMIKGPFVLRALFGESLAEQELETALNQAIMLFLKGCEKTV